VTLFNQLSLGVGGTAMAWAFCVPDPTRVQLTWRKHLWVLLCAVFLVPAAAALLVNGLKLA
jgi:hypothetical protein